METARTYENTLFLVNALIRSDQGKHYIHRTKSDTIDTLNNSDDEGRYKGGIIEEVYFSEKNEERIENQAPWEPFGFAEYIKMGRPKQINGNGRFSFRKS